MYIIFLLDIINKYIEVNNGKYMNSIYLNKKTARKILV